MTVIDFPILAGRKMVLCSGEDIRNEMAGNVRSVQIDGGEVPIKVFDVSRCMYTERKYALVDFADGVTLPPAGTTLTAVLE